MKFDFVKICNLIENHYNEVETFDELVELLNANGIEITDEELFEEAYKYPIIDSYLVSF